MCIFAHVIKYEDYVQRHIHSAPFNQRIHIWVQP